MRTTFGQIKESRIPQVLDLCPTDSRLAAFINEAQQRLIHRGKWWHCYQRYKVCVRNNCIVWPRHIAAIEAVAISDCPIPIRNEWFEFLPNGPGLLDESGCSLTLIDRGTSVVFNEIIGPQSVLRLFRDLSSDDGKRILVQGYDGNGKWIRTFDDVNGEYVDGEYLTVASPFTQSSHTYSNVTGIIKEVTNGPLRLYEYNPTSHVLQTIGRYEPDETTPVYRKSFIPGLDNASTCSSSSNNCNQKTVTVMAKLEFIPATRDTDFLLIGNIPALKFACQAIKKEEDNLFDEAEKYFAMAVVELEKELSHYLGDGPVVQLRTEGRATFGAGSVENPVGNYY